MILIYDDEGVSKDSIAALLNYFKESEAISPISGAELQNSAWIPNTRLLIIPGGRSLPFYEALGSAGNKNIATFVAQGGCYLGLCAGAYYAARETIFAMGLPLELQLPGALNFFSGRAIGPVFADELFAYASEAGARIVNIDWQNQQTYALYFNGGCYFESAEKFKNVAILARYSQNQLPAIIACNLGKGRAVLSGVHPELSFETVPDDAHIHHQSLRKSLLLADENRKKLLSHLIRCTQV
ncbi:MAG: hypothetical protein A3F13_08345 [Gammaproteobacteria bacterium RIFCSPHIGHO2_12_FULL_40_19]|nr:MAG: hypothetical protein A3F13_08345 [Gammaproteobacteria bacterium RIFCSPHIGHO2_12_FULL_40_19]